MVPLIFLIAVALFAASAASFWAALNLVPTDLGVALYQIAAIFVVSGGLALAIALATRALTHAFRASAPRMDRNARPVEPVLTDEAITPPSAAPAVMAGTAAAIGTAATLSESATAPEKQLLLGLESDLFKEIKQLPQPELPLSDDIVPPAPAPEVIANEIPAVEMAVEAAQSGEAWPDDNSVQAIAPSAEAEAPSWPPSPDVDHMIQPSEDSESETQVAPPDAASPGLIADADLAAMAEAPDLAPLAPLDTLDIVGAYDSAGTRFTMYSDGSVTAVDGTGEQRFRTLEDLRRHLDAKAAI